MSSPDVQHSIVTLLCVRFTCPESHQFFSRTLPPVHPSFRVSSPYPLSEAPSVPVFVFRRFFLDPSLVFPSLPVRNHPRSSRSDYNLPSTVFSLFFIVDKESRCFHSTQGFAVDIQCITLSLSSSFNPSQTITTGSSVFPHFPVAVVSEFLPDIGSVLLQKGGVVTHVHPQMSFVPCTFCRDRRVRHVADRYPLFSKTTCRSKSIFTCRINSSGAPNHPDLRCSHIMVVMVQA